MRQHCEASASIRRCLTTYIAHSAEDGRKQPLRTHLSNVAELASAFAEPFGAGPHARRAGLLHDAGKYSPAGQRRMEDPVNIPRVDHSSAGAQIASRQFKDTICAFVVAGHHSGLMDFGGKFDAPGSGTLWGRLKKALTGEMDCAAFFDEVSLPGGRCEPAWLLQQNSGFSIQFYTRMLYSCLVDADYLDTEAFIEGTDRKPVSCETPAQLADRLRTHTRGWLDHPTNALNEKRNSVLRDCIDAAQSPRGLYTLTVPTGGGKTIASLSFALEHAKAHNLKRIIYVIPYTSIIEQNAAVFKAILGEENVLEHHSGLSCDASEDEEDVLSRRKALATENWDAPVIVTTSVQFFESLFASRSSKCRKLHNIADSVVIFDEAQMLPVPRIKPCVDVISELVRFYGCTAVLCTATQPALESLFRQNALTSREIASDPNALRTFFKRVCFDQIGDIRTEDLADRLQMHSSVLCIVNTRKTAQTLYALLPEGGRFHLSTRMTPQHRSEVLKTIKARLRDGQTCRVVATSLIEAGVDVDFPCVYREVAGLDSIVQAAGRCNREGKHKAEDSVVTLFSLEDPPPRGLCQNIQAARKAIDESGDILGEDAMKRYFDALIRWAGEGIDARQTLQLLAGFNFKTAAQSFEMIEGKTFTVCIPDDENAQDIQRLKNGIVSRSLLRELAKSAVQVQRWDWDHLLQGGKIMQIGEDIAVLADADSYDPHCGLNVEVQPGNGLWF